ncbi:MAG: dockerin type I domain-containing protein [Planctomycetota bacterium]
MKHSALTLCLTAILVGSAHADGDPIIWLLGDVNQDCVVDQTDIDLVLMHWGTNEDPADVNGDGVVDKKDLDIVEWEVGEDCNTDDPDDPCDPYWTVSESFDFPCNEIKPINSCPLGTMTAGSYATGPAATGQVDGYEGGPFCKVQNQTGCGALRSWAYTFHDPCGGNCPEPFVEGASTGSGAVDAENVTCMGTKNWVVVYGLGEVKCSLWGDMEVCICTLEVAKDAESEWVYVGPIKVNGKSYDVSIPMTTQSGEITRVCAPGHGSGGAPDSMFTIAYTTMIYAEGQADGCIIDAAVTYGLGSLQNHGIVTLRSNPCDGGGAGGDPKIGS